METSWTVVESPIDPLTVVVGPRGITNVHFHGHTPRPPEAARRSLPQVTEQLQAYFAGERRAFELDVDLRGAPLQLAVWRQLTEIPYGKTTTYGRIAKGVDESLYDAGLEPYRRARVVGAAIGRNPVAVIVPCHRVIGADGALTGYFGGLQRKEVLLGLEGWTPASKARGRGQPDGQLAIGI